MYTIFTDNNATECASASDANTVIQSWFDIDDTITVCVELNDDDNNPLSYWEFTNGDTLLSDDCDP